MDVPLVHFGHQYFLEDREHLGNPVVFNNRLSPWDMSDRKFVKIFRLTKPVAQNLFRELEPRFPQATRTSAIPPDIRMLAALNYFASGSYQTGVGDARSISLSQASVSRCLHSFLHAIEPVLGNYIQFPNTENSMHQVKMRYWERYHFPGIIGVIDGTHIAIVPPPKNDPLYPEQDFINRKRFHSINTLVIADYDRRITTIWPKYPGRCHDAYIWYRSSTRQFLHQMYEEGLRNSWLLGDSGYALEKILMKPFNNPAPGSPQFRYNRAFTSARSSVECAIGLLKNRWRCLLKARTMHYHPTVAAKIITTCAALHNICINENIPLNLDNEEHFVNEEIDEEVVPPLYNLALGNRVRDNIVQNYFIN